MIQSFAVLAATFRVGKADRINAVEFPHLLFGGSF